MKSLLRATLNKTATMMRGQDTAAAGAGGGVASGGSPRLTAEELGVGGPSPGSESAAAMAEQLLGLPASRW